MKKIVNDYRMMLQACKMFYEEDRSQTEIAHHLELSRPTVKKLLQEARRRGLVQITIRELHGRNYLDLERRLERKLGLREAIIVDSAEDAAGQKELLARAAAAYLESILQEGCEVGVSMGTTLSRIPGFITRRCERLTFVPMIGGIGEVDINFHSNNIAEALAKAFHAQSLRLHAPSIVARAQTKRELLKEASIQRTLSHHERLDIALMGIGTAGPRSAIARTGYFTQAMFQEIRRSGVCGDICMYLYDRMGDTSRMLSNEGIIGIDIHRLRKIPYSIGVAGGREKADAIRGAVRGKFINILITDCACAGLLCEQSPDDSSGQSGGSKKE